MKTASSSSYQAAFANLSRFKNKNGASPNKPLLLPAVLDLIEDDALFSNLIPLNSSLEAAYSRRWEELAQQQKPSRIEYPFFHLASEGFWQLIENGGEVVNLELKRSRSRKELRLLDGAHLDEELWQLLQNKEGREALRRVLLETYFSENNE